MSEMSDYRDLDLDEFGRTPLQRDLDRMREEKSKQAMTSQPMTAVERVARAIYETMWGPLMIGKPEWENLSPAKQGRCRAYAKAALAALTPASEEVEKVCVRLLKAGERREWIGDGEHDQNQYWRVTVDPLHQEAASMLRRLDAERADSIPRYGLIEVFAREQQLNARIATLTAELATLRAQAGEKEWK